MKKTKKKGSVSKEKFVGKKKSSKSIFSELDEATKKSYESKDSFGEQADYFKKGVKIKKFYPKNGEHLIDIIPFIAGKSHPTISEGKPAYVLDVWVHRSVGTDGGSYVCLQKNYKQRCPICEHQRLMRKEGSYTDEEIKNLDAKRRVMYNVLCYDSQEEISKGVQIFETSHFFMEKHLAELAKKPKGGGFIPFAHPDEGKSISWTISKKGQYGEWFGHKFVDRDEEITEDTLEEAHILDEIIHIPTVKELEKVVKNAFVPSEDEEDEEDEDYEEDVEDEEEDVDEEDEDEEEEEERPKKSSKKKKTAPAKKSKKRDIEEDEDDDEDEDEDEDEEDEDLEDIEDFDDDEEEEEKPKKKAKPKTKKKVRR